MRIMLETDFTYSIRSDGTPSATSPTQSLLADFLWVEFGHAQLVDYFLSALAEWNQRDVFSFAANVMTVSISANTVTVEEDPDVMPPGRQTTLSLEDFLLLLKRWRSFLVAHGR